MALITSEIVTEIYGALSKAQAQMHNAKKASDNPYFKSKYADLADVWDVAQIPLTSNGLCVIQGTDSDADSVTVTCRLCHSSGQWVESSLRLVPAKRDPQGIGSAITYGRRYLLASMAGVVTDDDDGNAASGNKENKDEKTNKAQASKDKPQKTTQELRSEDPSPEDIEKFRAAAQVAKTLLTDSERTGMNNEFRAGYTATGIRLAIDFLNEVIEKRPVLQPATDVEGEAA